MQLLLCKQEQLPKNEEEMGLMQLELKKYIYLGDRKACEYKRLEE